MLIAVCFLTRKLKRIGIDCLKNSIKSINCQYGLFVGVYIPFIIIDILRLIYADEVDNILDSVTFNVLDLAAKCFTIQIPLIYMLFVHRRTFKRDESGQLDERGTMTTRMSSKNGSEISNSHRFQATDQPRSRTTVTSAISDGAPRLTVYTDDDGQRPPASSVSDDITEARTSALDETLRMTQAFDEIETESTL